MLILSGCAKEVIPTKAEFIIYSGGNVNSFVIKDVNKINDLTNLLDDCIKNVNLEGEEGTFDLPKGDAYKIVLKKENDHIYKFTNEYVVYAKKVYAVENYGSVIDELKIMFAV